MRLLQRHNIILAQLTNQLINLLMKLLTIFQVMQSFKHLPPFLLLLSLKSFNIVWTLISLEVFSVLLSFDLENHLWLRHDLHLFLATRTHQNGRSYIDSFSGFVKVLHTTQLLLIKIGASALRIFCSYAWHELL